MTGCITHATLVQIHWCNGARSAPHQSPISDWCNGAPRKVCTGGKEEIDILTERDR